MKTRAAVQLGLSVAVCLLAAPPPTDTPPKKGGFSGRTDFDFGTNAAQAEEAPSLQGPSRSPSTRATLRPRFFFAGNGHLVLQHGHFNTTLDVRYRRPDGTYDREALATIRHFFRSREDGREGAIALRLIELLAYVQERYHPREIILVSGYRSPEFNEDLRAAGRQVAQGSLHTQGLAADLTFTGLDLRRAWIALRELHAGGAGYYRHGNFVHIDTGPPRFWEESTSRVSEHLSADNARVFWRTDFDRYPQIDGAICSLHSVTALPIFISPHAKLVGDRGSVDITVEPASNIAVEQQDGCFAISAPGDAYEFRLHGGRPIAGAPTRQKVVLSTCEPRIGKTPAEIESNEIEVGSRP